jgi:hypothetical protein
MHYIIDFERINELSGSHTADKNSPYGASTVHSTTKNLIRKYIEVYESRSGGRQSFSVDEIKEAIDILVYNKILISPSDIRDRKIDKILK